MNRRTLLRSLPAALVVLVPGLRRTVKAQERLRPLNGTVTLSDSSDAWGLNTWSGDPHMELISLPRNPIVMEYPDDLYRVLAAVLPKPTIVETEHGKAWQYDDTFGGER